MSAEITWVAGVLDPGFRNFLLIVGTLGGYGSDTTRTLWVTGGDEAKGPDEAFRHLFGVLHAAHRAASAAVRPGVPAEAIDRAARDVIETTARSAGEVVLTVSCCSIATCATS